MFFSRAVRVASKAPLTFLAILTLLCLIATASVVSLNRLPTVSAAGKAAVAQRTAKGEPASQQTNGGTRQLAVDAYGALPLSLEVNRGQAPATTKFLSRGAGYQLSLTANEAILKLRERPQSATTAAAEPSTPPERRKEARELLSRGTRPVHAARCAPARMIELGMKLVDANPAPQIEAERELPGKSNYFVGNDAAQWRTNVSTYGRARYREIYPGIDLLFYGNQRQLEYDFIVGPGSDTDQIRLAFRGANKLEIEASGDLVLQLPGGGELRQPAPILYQEVDGVRRTVTGGYVLHGENQIGFRVGNYDRKLPLVIDPVLVYSTYLSFFATSDNGGIVIDAANNVYMTGASNDDVYVSKLNAAGTAFIYTTLVGGSGDGGWGDVGLGIAVDASGNAYVSGDAYSNDFPVVNAFQAVKSSEPINVPDAFVFKLDPTGSTLIFSTYLGGEDGDENTGIALDASGNAYVTGYTESPIHYINADPGAPFPTVNAYQPVLAGAIDAFLTKFTPTGAVVFSTYLGGDSLDGAFDVAVDDQGSAYLAGYTDSSDYPVQNALQSTHRGEGDLFITKFNPAGTALSYSTYLGGSSEDAAMGLTLDVSKNIYLTGYTYSADYPTQNPLYPAKSGGADAFVTKLNAAGSSLVYSTYVGGSGSEQGSDIALGAAAEPYITGYSGSSNFPVVNPIQGTNAGGADAVFFKLNAAGSALVYSTYLGGGSGTFGGGDYGQGVVVDSAGNGIFLGSTESDNFPTINPIGSPNAQPYSSAFLVKITESGNQTFYRISGRFESNVGNPISGVTVTLSGSQSASITTDGSLYSFTGLAAGGTYTVTPTRAGMSFDPPSQTFTNLSADQMADFMQAPRSYHITGRITDAQGNGIPSVIVDIGGYYYPVQTYTDPQGNFRLMYLEAGRTYTVTPRQDPYSFAPRSYTFPDLHSNQTPNFTALSNTHLGANLTSPAAGATFQAPASINVSADTTSTGSPVNRVEFYANSVLIGTDTSAPYAISWNNVTGGAYSLYAIAIDNAGAEKRSTAVSIIVNSVVGPVVQITSPADNVELLSGRYITLSADATSANGPMAKVEFYEDVRLLGTDTGASGPYTLSYYLYAGTYTLTAVGYDASGAVTRSAPVHLSVRDNQPPTVFVPNIAGGPFFPEGATVTLTADASDADGTIAEVQFYANSTVLVTDTTAPYSFTWSNVPSGSYTIVAHATDNQGAVTYSNYRTIRFGNSPPTVVMTSPSSTAQYGAPASIPLAASPHDSDGTITQVEFITNGTVIGVATTAPYTFTWNNVPAGNYNVAARATDNSGATGTSYYILIQVFGSLPTVTITSPANGAHFNGSTGISILSTVNSANAITSVWYRANGRYIGIVNQGPEYGMTWDGVLAGTYTLVAEAWDTNSAVGTSAPVTITVSGASWELQAPRISGLNSETVESVYMVSALEGWAGGEQGLIVHTTDGGLNWTRQTSGITDALWGISFSDALHGVAVGNTILYTANGGQTWQQGTGSLGTLYDVDMVDQNNAWACGGGGTIARTTNGGQTWTTQQTPIADFANLVGIDFVDANSGWAVGQGGTIIATTNGGTNWVNQNSNTTSYFAGVSFVSTQEGWAVAGNLFLHTTNGGQSWIPQTVPANTWAYDVHFVDVNNGWAAGSQENIVHTNDGGATWTTQRPATFTNPLWAVSFGSAQRGVAVGHDGTALSTTDGGLTWTRSERSINPEPVFRLTGTDSNHVWSGNSAGDIMYTTNGGAVWSHAVLTPTTTNDVVGIDFSDNANGWAALRNPNVYTGECSIYRSTDGGQTWQLSITAVGQNHYNDIAALDAQTAVVVGSGSNFLALIRRTTDGGQTWNTMPVPASANVLYAVDFINATTGWAAGNSNTMLKTTDGGQTWTSQTVLADYLMDVSFSDENNGWAVGYYDYLHTTNGGQTWQSNNTQGYPTLQGVHTVSASTAWFVGDGYVARTLDGGATWTSETLGDFRYFRSAYFTDADNGWVGANWTTGEIYHRSGGANPNAPTVTITEPANGASFPAGSNLTIRAEVSSPNGPVAFVDFYDGPTLLGRDNTAPYSLQWNNVPTGTHSIMGVATEGSGAMRFSESASVTIVDEPPISISGRVLAPSGAGLPNVTVQLVSPGSSQSLTTTDASGNYSFAGVPAGGPYTITPSKIGDVNGIESLDAAFAVRYVAGLELPTTNQRLAADADGDGILTSYDASLIARRAAGLPDTGIVGTWKFSPASLSYSSLSADQTGQAFTAILVGDTSGSWFGSAAQGGLGGNAQQSVTGNARVSASSPQSPNIVPTVTVSLPHVTGPTATNITVPITVGNLTGQGVKAYDLQITFDATKVIPQGTPFDTAGTISSGMLITPNANNAGRLIISAFQATDLTGSGTLINLKFTIVSAPGQFTLTTFQDYTDPGTIFHPGFRFNGGTTAATISNGSIHVNGPTAAAARMGGQIVTADGQPVSGATVTVLGGAGTVRVITDSNGVYRVENLEAGGFYTVTPSRANFVFAPANRAFSLLGDRTDAVFTGAPINPDANPLESPEFFVRQQYLDFLGREPEQSGLDYWSGQLRSCGQDLECINTRRTSIASAFYIAQEFQDSGLYIYDVYEGALGRRPDHAEYAGDRRSVVGGPRLEADKAAFALSFVERAEFNAQYPLTMSDEVFVDALLRTAQQSSGLDLTSSRADLVTLYNSGASATESRSLVLRSVVEGSRFKQTQYNPAFVLMEYYGYLGRNPDRDGYDFWLNILNNGDRNNYRGMVCSFLTSAEYQRRFSSVVTRSNAECAR
jgi:photosystem II stability/assembly factor-like uncharacterized protein